MGSATQPAFAQAPQNPCNALIYSTDHTKFYGTSIHGGTNSYGTVYSYTISGSSLSTLLSSYPNGTQYWSPVTIGSDGDLYFDFSRTDGQFFQGYVNPSNLTSSIQVNGTGGGTDLVDYGGKLWGGNSTSLFYFPEGNPSSVTTLSTTESGYPHFNGLTLYHGSDGDWFYGTTQQGGLNHTGSIFRIKADGTSYQTLFSFDAWSNPPTNTTDTDGAEPNAITIASDSYIYGTC